MGASIVTDELKPALVLDLGESARQLRFAPIAIGGGRHGFLAVHSGCSEVDPYHRMFFLPTDTLKLTAFSADGKRLWRRDLGPGVVPGVWFCPVLPFDLNGDGVDEIYFVDNADPEHALDYESYILRSLDAAEGAALGNRPWPMIDFRQDMSRCYRNFIHGAFSSGRPRLITCQGTYGSMQLQCSDEQMGQVWSRKIAPDDPAARGSHMFPIVDIDADGRDELLWGERCIDVDTGADIWIGDEAGWHGHSDVIQPTLDSASGGWCVYTCREAGPPRGAVVMYDRRGRELWGRRGMGHMDMGWTARLGPAGEHLCYALQIGDKTAGPRGFQRSGNVEYLFDMGGQPLDVKFPLYQSLPVDFNGDGLHELTYIGGERGGLVVDRTGRPMHRLAGSPAYGGKLLDVPGEQIVTCDGGGKVRIYACPDAKDSPAAVARYQHPYYDACLRVWAVGYNRTNLGGL